MYIIPLSRMGAWASEPFENDTAADWIYSVGDALKFILNSAFWSRWDEEGIAASALLTELPDRVKKHLGSRAFNEALEVVERQLQPEQLKPWKSPKRREKVLQDLRRSLMFHRAWVVKLEKKWAKQEAKLRVVIGKTPRHKIIARTQRRAGKRVAAKVHP